VHPVALEHRWVVAAVVLAGVLSSEVLAIQLSVLPVVVVAEWVTVVPLTN
jgi:hypothetical protein